MKNRTGKDGSQLIEELREARLKQSGKACPIDFQQKVAFALTQGVSATEIMKATGVSSSSLYKWKRRYSKGAIGLSSPRILTVKNHSSEDLAPSQKSDRDVGAESEIVIGELVVRIHGRNLNR